ncbi:MAG: DUF4369 domain-containing protein [Flavobacteriaceae bacterium]|nr:DUF4369 domain-containing protein [Flavobacteriaceae bacterium]
MKKFIIIIFAIICSCLSDKDEINISGEIKGLNNSFIYLIQPDNNTLLDSSKVVNEKFDLTAYINEPLELVLKIQSKDSENIFSFISEPSAKIIFTSSKEKFEFNGKIENSDLNYEFEKLNDHINRYNDIDLQMLEQQIQASIENNNKKYDSLNEERLKVDQKKILFIVNYCLNNNTNILSPYLAYKYKNNINLGFLENIYQNLSEEMRETYYGRKLINP